LILLFHPFAAGGLRRRDGVFDVEGSWKLFEHQRRRAGLIPFTPSWPSRFLRRPSVAGTRVRTQCEFLRGQRALRRL